MTTRSFYHWLTTLFLWTVVTIVGYILGYALLFSLVGDQPDVTWIIAIPIGLVVTGLLVGLGQWFVIRSSVKLSASWILVSMAGLLVGWPTGYFVLGRLAVLALESLFGENIVQSWLSRYYEVYEIVAIIFGGVIIGTFQWLVLRRKLSASGWWIPVSVFAWGSGHTIARWAVLKPAIGALYSGENNAVYGAVFGSIEGMIVGTITGLGIVMLAGYSDKFRYRENVGTTIQ